MDREQIIYKIKHFIPYVFGVYKGSGYIPLEKDNRDFKIGSFFGLGAYTPKSSRILLPTLSVKNQNSFNTCVFNSATACKEPDEGVILSVRSLVSQAWRSGLTNGNGYSDLRSAQQLLKTWGIQEEKDLPDGNYSFSNDFNNYVNVLLDQSKANQHKTSSFWTINSKDQIIQALDQKRIVHVAIEWYTGYNMGGGFSAPWLITKSLGYSVGGHALAVVGYDLNYQGKKVFIIQKSYGEQWGEHGKFYIDMDFLVKEMNKPGFGCYANLDLGVDTASFINGYDGKDVKAFNSPAIYHIQNNTKKVYPDWVTFLAWTDGKGSFSQLNQADTDALNKLSNGDAMDITKTVYWPMLQTLSAPDNLNKLLEILHSK